MKKPEPISSESWVWWCAVPFGYRMYFLLEPTQGMIGFVWGVARGANQGGKRVFEVYGSYVPRTHRRRGVRTRINKAILGHHEVIITCTGTKEGKAFMKSAGYKLSKEIGCWVKR